MISICFLALAKQLACSSRKQFQLPHYKALNGYDIGLSDPFADAGDPAIRSTIFDVDCYSETGKGHWDFVSVDEGINCKKSFKTDIVTSNKGYARQLGSNTEVSGGFS